MATARRTRAASDRTPSRVAPEARRAQLVQLASELLTEHGLEMVQIKEVAERAGVSRPLVYRLFPTRKALVRAVLEDFAADLGARFHEALVQGWPGTLDRATDAFVSACCDAIEARGAGPWLLLDAHAVEPELARLGRATLDELLDPWKRHLSELGALSPRRASTVLRVVVAAGRAALDPWLEGTASREQATRDAVRAVTALLHALAIAPQPPPVERQRRPKTAAR